MDAGTRAFLVKIALPAGPTSRSGMFGRAHFTTQPRRARRSRRARSCAGPDGIRVRDRAGHRAPAAGQRQRHRGARGSRPPARPVVAMPPPVLTDGRRVTTGRPAMAPVYGAAGRLAAAFIHSKLTPLFIGASLALGAFAIVALPREEEPQIIVPMVDVFVEMPGASPAEVEQRVTRPMEKLLWEIPGVEYLYSTSAPGQSMVVVRFRSARTKSGARPAQPEAAGELRSHPARRVAADRQTAVDRRRADPGAHAFWSARYDDDQTAAARRRSARRDRGSARCVGGDAHRRPARAGPRRGRSRAAGRLRARPLAMSSARSARPTSASTRAASRRRTRSSRGGGPQLRTG